MTYFSDNLSAGEPSKAVPKTQSNVSHPTIAATEVKQWMDVRPSQPRDKQLSIGHTVTVYSLQPFI